MTDVYGETAPQLCKELEFIQDWIRTEDGKILSCLSLVEIVDIWKRLEKRFEENQHLDGIVLHDMDYHLENGDVTAWEIALLVNKRYQAKYGEDYYKYKSTPFSFTLAGLKDCVRKGIIHNIRNVGSVDIYTLSFDAVNVYIEVLGRKINVDVFKDGNSIFPRVYIVD